MTLDRAKVILKNAIAPDGGLTNLCWYIGWTPGYLNATLDGSFSADELEAIAVYMRQDTPVK